MRFWGPRRDGKGKSEAPTTIVDWLELPFRLLGDALSFADDGFGPALLAIVALAAFVVFMIFVGGPLLVLLVETLLIVPIVVIVGVLVRIMFRRPWTIEATDGSRRVEWKVVGWGASSRAADRMASEIAATGAPERVPSLDSPRAHRRHTR